MNSIIIDDDTRQANVEGEHCRVPRGHRAEAVRRDRLRREAMDLVLCVWGRAPHPPLRLAEPWTSRLEVPADEPLLGA